MRPSIICPSCATACDPDDGVACRTCGAFLGASPLVGSAHAGDPPRADASPPVPRGRWPWRRTHGDDLLPDAERRRRRWRRIGGGVTMLAAALGTTVWWQRTDPSSESARGGEGVVADVAEFDLPEGRPVREGGETTLGAVYTPAAAIYLEWADWSQVTPPALGAAMPRIGIVAADRSPERADEVSLAVEEDGVVFGTLNLVQGPDDCVWLRDIGLGPEVVHGFATGDCSALAAPDAGWEPVEV